jgi:trans-AT polyketide synthase, acyltransferase and oxidoreductase domains
MSTTGERRQALREQIVRWNQNYPVGTTVNCEVYPGRIHRTSSPATLLFERKAVIYLEGFSGYFHLDDVHPLAEPSAMAEKRTAYLFPGQGAQSRGMGRELLAAFPEQTRLASQVLGYSIERLCLEDPEGLLDQTRYTQVAIYVVNALGYRHHLKTNPASRPAFLMGHSIGEYNALLAADVFDFETGLRLVMKRGELMGNISGGAMAAVRGTTAERIRETLHSSSLDDIDLANYNTPLQTVISGPAASIERAVEVFTAQRIKAARLRVSGAFHSRYMQIAQEAFASYLRAFTFARPRVPVIANATGTPYEPDHIAETLCAQIASPVRWLDSIRYILDQGEMEFAEIGSTFLHGMVREISASSLAVK